MRRSVFILLAAAPTLAAQSPDFSAQVFPLLKKAGCADCHNSNGVASTTRLIFPDAEASAPEIRDFGDSLRNLVDLASPSASLLLAKPTNRGKHAGGERIKQGSPEEALWKSWVEHLATTSAKAGSSARADMKQKERNLLRRLTHSQYDRTVRDLVGDSTFPSRQFPPEDFIDGFKNQYHGQSISPILAESYGAAAEQLAAEWRGKDGPRFMAEFGKKAFRRPLTPAETKRYAALHTKGGAKLVVEAMLQSPSFLYRLESTPDPALRRYARASRLSYLLWDTMPDAALIAAAERGELDTPDGFQGAARRILADPKAREASDEFISQWLRFDRVLTMVKERRSYPMFTRELALAMTEETRRLASELIWGDRSFMEFYTAGYAYLNADLAALYNLPPPPEEFARVSFPADSERAGILGQGTFLALTAKPAETSITARGLFVRENFLCQQVPQPPPGLNASLPSQAEDKPRTNRQLLELHLTNPSCASCHDLVDPIGYGLEKFDGVGGRREAMKVDIPTYNRRVQPKSVQLPIDAGGWVTGIKNSEFSSPRDLGRVLAANAQCQECVVKQYFRYAMSRHETAADRDVIARVTEEFRQSGFRFRDMMVSLVKWTEFPPRAPAGTSISTDKIGGGK